MNVHQDERAKTVRWTNKYVQESNNNVTQNAVDAPCENAKETPPCAPAVRIMHQCPSLAVSAIYAALRVSPTLND